MPHPGDLPRVCGVSTWLGSLLKTPKLVSIFFILIVTTPVWAADSELLYDPANPAASQGLKLVAGRIPLARSQDYFKRAGLSFRVSDIFVSGAAPVYLIIEHSDSEIGLLQVSYDADRTPNDRAPEDDPANTPASDAVGYTCLGTGKMRRAIFKFERPAFRHRQQDGADIRIEGLAALKRLRLTTSLSPDEWEKVRAEIPVSASPRVKLSPAMQLVITVGADSQKREDLAQSLSRMRELCPLAHALGFNGIESYVKWNFVEHDKGNYDWSYYDAIVTEARKYGLRWFPLLIAGSAYALPGWYHDSPLNSGFICLEHGLGNDIQSIFCENQTPFVHGFLRAFGTHYEPMNVLLGVRLGPSGNYGESQYPAGGNWGYKWQPQHIHIGWWAGDAHAAPHFQSCLRSKYSDIAALNQAWGESYSAFDAIKTFIPQFAESKRKRKDMVDWYMGAMTDWCERWAVWAREAMPKTEIYQSAGGWGFVESGTDFTEQTRSMAKIQGGIRATNETDSYAQNFYATRMLSSAARFYKVPFGSEPAGYGSARGVVARIYNILVNNGQHLFYYFPNLLHNDQAAAKWLELAPLLDHREAPFIEIAALYPDTKSKLDDAVFRNLYAFAFNQRVAALRPHLDFDFCSERMILDGALSQYKALLFLWSDVVEADVLQRIDQWVQAGGTVTYPYWNRMPLGTVEDDYRIYNRWLKGETGRGRVVFYRSDREPPQRYADFIRRELMTMQNLDSRTRKMLAVMKPAEVYVSVLQSGTLAILNYNNESVRVSIPGSGVITVKPYHIALLP